MKVVVAWIERPDGKVLLQRRPEDKAYGGCWELPGGKVEKEDATDQKALIRELCEELNLVNVKIADTATATLSLSLLNGLTTLVLYSVKLANWRLVTLLEADIVGWFDLDKVPEPQTPSTKPFLAAIRIERKKKLVMRPEEFAALPEAARRYIHDLEANVDPAGEVRRCRLAEDENAALRKAVEDLQHKCDDNAASLGLATVVLKWLDDLGGLGHDKHERIAAVLSEWPAKRALEMWTEAVTALSGIVTTAGRSNPHGAAAGAALDKIYNLLRRRI